MTIPTSTPSPERETAGRPIGLTGGIASGKSLATSIFAELGIPIIDTDAISRELVEPGSPCLDAIQARFGGGILLEDGRLDRDRLRRIILDQPGERAALEAILHPAIRTRARERATAAARQAPYVLVVVPLLAEASVWPAYRDWLDAVITLTAPPALRRERLTARPGIDARQAEQLIAAQVDDRARQAIADFELVNDRSPEALREQIIDLDRRLRHLGSPRQGRHD
ncbi:dephospho-CoA kinase [Guyparkeria halophila]|uniref:Dephospho-CoA kinase n=1 Tax=Guyparkeria halophila TaxID=47960 RepID=A0ABZ0YX95_9GAMM|nr:dephospho-CoA kinase [Guyparkeria halophila]WQH16783.1 dephospho-CoA kinase [Guyparkeria halophila]